MIPHESLGKEVYNVSSFGLDEALNLLISYPCVYYTCGEYERASEQVSRFNRTIDDNSLGRFIIIRRVGRRVVAERGSEFDAARVEAGWDAIVDRDIPRYRVTDNSMEDGASVSPELPPSQLDHDIRSVSTSDWSSISSTELSEDNE